MANQLKAIQEHNLVSAVSSSTNVHSWRHRSSSHQAYRFSPVTKSVGSWSTSDCSTFEPPKTQRLSFTIADLRKLQKYLIILGVHFHSLPLLVTPSTLPLIALEISIQSFRKYHLQSIFGNEPGILSLRLPLSLSHSQLAWFHRRACFLTTWMIHEQHQRCEDIPSSWWLECVCVYACAFVRARVNEWKVCDFASAQRESRV